MTFEEVCDHFRALEIDPYCPDRLNVLLDFSQLRSFPKADQVRDVVGQIARIRNRVRFENCAVIAGEDAVYGIGRMFEALAQDWFREVSVFRKSEQAEEWLRLPSVPNEVSAQATSTG